MNTNNIKKNILRKVKATKFWDALKLYKVHYLLGILTVAVLHLLQVKIPELTGLITDEMQSSNGTNELYKNKILLIMVIGGMIAISQYLWRYFIAVTTRKIECDLRSNYYEHLQDLSMDYINSKSVGEFMSRCTNDLNVIRRMIGPGFVMLLDFIFLSTMVVYKMIMTVNFALTILVLIPLPFIGIGNYIIGKELRRFSKEKQESIASMTSFVRESIDGIRVVKAFTQESGNNKEFDKLNTYFYNKNMKVIKLAALSRPLVSLVYGISIMFVLGFGGYYSLIGEISLGDIVALIQYILLLIWPMRSIGAFVNAISTGSSSLKRYNSIFDKASEHTKETGQITKFRNGNISINNLTFIYKNTKHPALININLEILKNEIIGIIGRNGSGKSTLANLFLQLNTPSSGMIRINNLDISEYNIKTLRKNIGYVPQDSILLSNTIYDNIRFSESKFSNEQIEEYSEFAHIHNDIKDFDKGYETMVGERGVNLSGGQKQRICIARTLLRDKPILILDDSFSSVDVHTEKKIIDSLELFKGKKTMLIISQRISSIIKADRIVVMDEGRIIDVGKHADLLDRNELYISLFNEQFVIKEINDNGGLIL